MALTVSHRQVDRLVRDLKNVSNGARRAAANAINDTLKFTQKVGLKEYKKVYTAKPKEVKKSIKLHRARARASRMSGRFVSKDPSLPLTAFSYTRQGKKGVSVRIRRDRAKTLIKSSFKATMATTHEGVFIRKRFSDLKGVNLGKARTRATHMAHLAAQADPGRSDRVPRLPIEQLFGPSAPAMFENERVMPAMEAQAGKELERAVGYRINRLLIGKRK